MKTYFNYRGESSDALKVGQKSKGYHSNNQTLSYSSNKMPKLGTVAIAPVNAVGQDNKYKKNNYKKKKEPFTSKTLSIRELKKLMKPEIKYYDGIDQFPIPVLGLVKVTDLAALIGTQGAGNSSRIGDKIQIIAVDWIWTIIQPTFVDDPSTQFPLLSGYGVEFALRHLPSQNGHTPSLADFYDPTHISYGRLYAPRVINGIKSRTLERVDLEVDGTKYETNIRRNHMVVNIGQTVYNGTGGGSSNVQQNGLCFTMVSSTQYTHGSVPIGYTDVLPTVTMRYRIKYIDV